MTAGLRCDRLCINLRRFPLRTRTLLAIALAGLSGVALAQPDVSNNPPADQQNSVSPVTPEPVPAPPLPQTAPPAPPQIPEAAAANPVPLPNTTTVTTTVTGPVSTVTAPNASTITGAASAASAIPPDADKGLKTASVASVGVQFVSVQPAYVMSSNLIGTSVYNNQNEALGVIRDLVIDSNKITGIIVNVGGFLGLGESYVVIDPSTVTLAQMGGVWKAFVDTSKDNLKSAPKFTYAKKAS
jgi:sporulation protein YlmC with PRC-barrel domain